MPPLEFADLANAVTSLAVIFSVFLVLALTAPMGSQPKRGLAVYVWGIVTGRACVRLIEATDVLLDHHPAWTERLLLQLVRALYSQVRRSRFKRGLLLSGLLVPS